MKARHADAVLPARLFLLDAYEYRLAHVATRARARHAGVVAPTHTQ